MPKKALRLPALILFGIFTIYGCVLAPLNEVLLTDAVLFETVLWDLVDWLFALFEVLGIAAAFGLIIHAVLRYTAPKCVPLYILTGGALLFKYVASIIALSIVRGSFDLTMDYTPYLLSFSIEVAEVAFVAILAHFLITNAQYQSSALQKAAKTLGQEQQAVSDMLPFQKKLFSRTNPLLRTAFWGSVAVGIIRLTAFIIDEISYYHFFGSSYTFTDVLISLVYCVTHVLIPTFLGYLLTIGCIKLAERNFHHAAQNDAEL